MRPDRRPEARPVRRQQLGQPARVGHQRQADQRRAPQELAPPHGRPPRMSSSSASSRPRILGAERGVHRRGGRRHLPPELVFIAADMRRSSASTNGAMSSSRRTTWRRLTALPFAACPTNQTHWTQQRQERDSPAHSHPDRNTFSSGFVLPPAHQVVRRHRLERVRPEPRRAATMGALAAVRQPLAQPERRPHRAERRVDLVAHHPRRSRPSYSATTNQTTGFSSSDQRIWIELAPVRRMKPIAARPSSPAFGSAGTVTPPCAPSVPLTPPHPASSAS